jgi:hypothetical protein
MGGGSEIPILTSTSADAGIGTAKANAKRIVPNSNFFMLLPPLAILPAFLVDDSRHPVIGPHVIQHYKPLNLPRVSVRNPFPASVP